MPDEAPSWQEPAARSPQCTAILERIGRHRWKPAEATLWREADAAAKRAGVHPWEWRNLILRAYFQQVAADPHGQCPWPVRRVPHCPSQVFAPATGRDGTRYIQALCTCPDPGASSWNTCWHRVHWVGRHWSTGERTAHYCQCGLHEDPPGSGRWAESISGAYACTRCAEHLETATFTYSGALETAIGRVGNGSAWSHRLKHDCRCCYCGGTALKDLGWRLSGHPPFRAWCR